MCATALALGYAIGRIGCQVSGDGDYGIRSNLPWAMGYPHGTVPTPPGVTVQPTPIYETVTMCLVAYLLWHIRDKVRPGVVFALYLVLSGLERFLVEFIRRNKEVLAGLTAPQVESLVLLAIGLVWLALMTREGGLSGLRAKTSAPRPTSAPDARAVRRCPEPAGDNPRDGYRDGSFAGISARQPAERARAAGGGRLRHRGAGARVRDAGLRGGGG